MNRRTIRISCRFEYVLVGHMKKNHQRNNNASQINARFYLWQDEGESERASPIPEEDIEEDLVPAMDSVCLDNRDKDRHRKPASFKPTDTIVLELEAPPTKSKSYQGPMICMYM